MDATTQIARLQEFFSEHFQAELLENIRRGKERLIVDFEKLAFFDPELATMLLDEPENTLKACEIAVEQLEGAKGFTVRFRGLPTSAMIPVRDMRAKHLGKFLELTGIVRQKSDVRPQVTTARFECPSCGNIIAVLQLDGKFREPTRCGCGRKGKFRLLSKELVDAQKIVLEESPDDLEGGEQPKRLNIFLQKDLVSPITDKRTNPGSKVGVTGYLKEVPIVLREGGQSTRYDIMLEVNHIEPVEEDYSQIQISPEEEAAIQEIASDPNPLDRLVKSLAPSVYGHDRIKEAIVLQLLGGVKKKRSDGNSTRGDLHILLVGDPGSGKSTLLKRSQVVAPKSRFVSGKGASAAGLTASVVRDEFLKGWALEAGALVLANKGFCVTADTLIRTAEGEMRIDELHKRFVDGTAPDVLGIDYETLALRPDKIKNISVREDSTDTITLENGDSLTITNEHPILVWDNGYRWKEAGDIAEGEHVFTRRSFTQATEYPLIVDLMPESTFVDYDVTRISSFTPAEVSRATKIPEHRLAAENRLTIADVRTLCKHFGTSYDEEKLQISLPDLPKHVTAEIGEFAGLVASDGHLRKVKCGVVFHNKSEELVERFTMLSLQLFGKEPRAYNRDGHQTLIFSSPNVHTLLQRLGVRKGNKSRNAMDFSPMRAFPADFLQAFFCGYVNGDGSITARKTGGILTVVGGSRETLESLRTLIRPLGILGRVSSYDSPGGGVCSEEVREMHRLVVTGVSNFHRIEKSLLMTSKQQQLEMILGSRDLSHRIPRVDRLYQRLNSQIPHSEKQVLYRNGLKISQLKRYAVSRPVFEKTTRELAQMNPAKFTEEIKLFTRMLDEDMVCLKVRHKITSGVTTVYNLQMQAQEHPNFIANNFITHNCMIDELDKMSPEDRSAFHEALESQTVSISKANIQATLRCETVVLAAANPKFGRFDPYELLAKQIDLPPALINRFDLIFPVRDLPGEDKDRQLASFVLQLQQTGDIQEVPVSTNILRKFISMARSRCFPRLTDEAVKEIREFYVTMRNSESGGEGISAIPISARQLEALVRMSEASARSRLGKEVTKDDALRAIDLLMYCLQQLGVDPVTGKIDIDRLTTGVTASSRNQVHTIKEIIRELADVTGNPLVAEEEILAKASEKGIAEDKADEILERLNRLGDIFRPKPGFYSMMK